MSSRKTLGTSARDASRLGMGLRVGGSPRDASRVEVEVDVADDEGGSPVARRSNPSSEEDAMAAASPYVITLTEPMDFWVGRSGNPARGVVTGRRIALS
jgi:hypothetical protein|tara:strand:+ start:90 stop:386 length:297 start_codon:yes stop_codon:yes gene_type:complete